jgi:hypothetical protein
MITINTEYSDQEIRMFRDLGWSYLFEGKYVDHPIAVWAMYKMAVEKAFINNNQGPEVEALRKGMKAITECKPYRNTPEFEELIHYA